ncbi:MAG TPA: ATP synthase F0 subunit B [Geopsychrobacteraceae bacterium]|nr:ATP synthase F0 subunit B [Geopsychrobacteraceae bacterium]
MINLDWTLVLQFLNFVVLLVVLNKLLYRPLRSALEQRRETIDGSHDKAKSLQGEIEEKMARYQAQLSEAKATASQERSRLKQKAVDEESTILGEAQQKAAARLQVIKSQVADEATEASKTLKTEAKELAGQIATKVLGRELV